MRKFLTGKSSIYGNLVAVSQEKTEVNETNFYQLLESSLKKNNLYKHGKEAKLIKNLKKGVSLGSDFFQIKDIKQ